MMAGFSRLAPGAHIVPHRGYEGYSGYVLRLHLGLQVPDGCAMRVHRNARLEGKRVPGVRRLIRARGMESQRSYTHDPVVRFSQSVAATPAPPRPSSIVVATLGIGYFYALADATVGHELIQRGSRSPFVAL